MTHGHRFSRLENPAVTPELTQAVEEALEARELIKISCSYRTVWMIRKRWHRYWLNVPRSQVVQVIGKKIVLYKEGKDNKKKIVLPEK